MLANHIEFEIVIVHLLWDVWKGVEVLVTEVFLPPRLFQQFNLLRLFTVPYSQRP